jgi:hypothetical protein
MLFSEESLSCPTLARGSRLNSKISLHKSFRDLITSHLARGVLLQSGGLARLIEICLAIEATEARTQPNDVEGQQ